MYPGLATWLMRFDLLEMSQVATSLLLAFVLDPEGDVQGYFVVDDLIVIHISRPVDNLDTADAAQRLRSDC